MDEFIQPAGAADRLELRVGHAGEVVGEVFTDRALEQPRVLQHHAEQALHVLALDVRRRDAVDFDAAVRQLVEAHQQIDHRRLARAGGADDGDLLAGGDVGGEVLDDDLIRGIRVAEADVLEIDRAADRAGQLRLCLLVRQLLARKEVEDAVRGGRGRLQVRHTLRDLGQG